MNGRNLTAIAVAMVGVVLIIILAAHDPMHEWSRRDAGPRLHGVELVLESDYKTTALFSAELNRLHDLGYTIRACAGGLGGRMCAMEHERKIQ